MDWTMKDIDRSKYENLFVSLKPVNGLLHGNAVKDVILNTFGKIWDFADQDRDGSLDKHEFTVAMHLVHQALDMRPLPEKLPPELLKGAPSGEGFGDGGFVANFPSDIGPLPVPPLPASISRVQPPNMMPLISTDPIVPTAQGPVQQIEWVNVNDIPEDLLTDFAELIDNNTLEEFAEKQALPPIEVPNTKFKRTAATTELDQSINI